MRFLLFLLLTIVLGHRHLHRRQHNYDPDSDLSSYSDSDVEYPRTVLYYQEGQNSDSVILMIGLLVAVAGTIIAGVAIRLWMLETEDYDLRIHHPAYPPGYTPPLPNMFARTDLYAANTKPI